MKKVYKRPMIEIEEFTLAAHIANCGGAGADSANSLGKPLHEKESCGWQINSGRIIFVEKDHGCRFPVPDGNYNGYCYHVPNPKYTLFSS